MKAYTLMKLGAATLPLLALVLHNPEASATTLITRSVPATAGYPYNSISGIIGMDFGFWRMKDNSVMNSHLSAARHWTVPVDVVSELNGSKVTDVSVFARCTLGSSANFRMFNLDGSDYYSSGSISCNGSSSTPFPTQSIVFGANQLTVHPTMNVDFTLAAGGGEAFSVWVHSTN